jgi:hypothetical protein
MAGAEDDAQVWAATRPLPPPLFSPPPPAMPDAEHVPELRGFPPGYFLIRSLATGRLLSVARSSAADGAPLVLWPTLESSLVESARARRPHARAPR